MSCAEDSNDVAPDAESARLAAGELVCGIGIVDVVVRSYKRSEDAHPIIPVTPRESANATLIAHIVSNPENEERYSIRASRASNHTSKLSARIFRCRWSALCNPHATTAR